MIEIEAFKTDSATIAAARHVEKEGRITAEEQAGAQMRDAAMQGLVRRGTLSDISQLPGSTIREKQGQRRSQSIPLKR